MNHQQNVNFYGEQEQFHLPDKEILRTTNTTAWSRLKVNKADQDQSTWLKTKLRQPKSKNMLTRDAIALTRATGFPSLSMLLFFAQHRYTSFDH